MRVTGSKGTNTVQTQSSPPAQYLDAYSAANTQAQQVASTPYQSYTGQTVAQLAPDQTAGLGQIEGLTANGGVQSPYLASAQSDITNATQPVLTPSLQSNISASSGQALAAPTAQAVSGIQGATSAGTAGITGAASGLTPASLQQWESPYTQDVVNSTQAEFNNQNAQQQSQVAGNAISSGAFGGDRAAVASALTAQQEQLAQAPVIAGLENTGYTTALGAAQSQAGLQTQAATSAGSLGLQGATAAGQAGMSGATTGSQLGLQGASTTLGANEAQGWLSSQAGFGEANLGSEAQSTGLQGASSLLSAGSLEQGQAQANLNVPYEQYLAAQAYPFQTAGWEANIAEGLGGASGGTSSTTSPGASVASQVGGLGLGAIGLSQSGALSGIGNLFNSGVPAAGTQAASDAGIGASGYADTALQGTVDTAEEFSARGGGLPQKRESGGMVPNRAGGGGLGSVSASMMPKGADPNLNIITALKSPTVSSTTSTGGPQQLGTLAQVTNLGSEGAASYFGTPIAGMAAHQFDTAYPELSPGGFQQDIGGSGIGGLAVLARGGMIPHRDNGGTVSAGNEPYGNMKPVTGPATSVPLMPGSTVPAAPASHGGLGIPRAPQAARVQDPEQQAQQLTSMAKMVSPNHNGAQSPETQDGMATGGMIPRRDAGGATTSSSSDPSQTTVVVQPGTQTVDSSQSWQTPLIQENLDNQMTAMLAPAAAATDDTASMKSGGMVQHYDAGGFTSSDTPWWSREEENQSVNRHGLLASPVAGRTDHLAVSPATGSYVIPADVISGLGEGNTLAGANVMQKILETGPHGIRMPQERRGMGPPRPPPAYREGEGDDGMASGGGLPHYASGGMSPAVSAYLASNGTGGSGLPSGGGSAVPSTGINASTGKGTSDSGIPALDAYLNQTIGGASYAPPPAVPAAPVAAAATPPSGLQAAIDAVSIANNSSSGMARGGMLPRRADGGPASGDDMGLPDYSGHIQVPQFDDDGDALPPSHPLVVASHAEAPPVSAKDEDLPVPPVPPDHSSSTPNRLLRPHSDIKVTGGMQPAGQPTSSTPDTSPSPIGMHPNSSPRGTGLHGSDVDSYMSHFQPSKPDPWLDLALAGFSMAAGKSPHALENIGAGAERGVAAYAQQKQEADKEGLQAGETAARLADTAAYREGVLGNRGDANDIKRSQINALGQYRQRAQDLQAQGLSIKDAHEQAWQEFQTQGIGIRQQNADTTSTGTTNRNNLGLANLAQKQEAQDALNQYREQVQQRLSQGMDLKTAHEQTWQKMQGYLQQHHATQEDINLARAFNPITGKSAFPDPHASAQKLRDQNAPEVSTAMPPPATAKPDVSSLWGN